MALVSFVWFVIVYLVMVLVCLVCLGLLFDLAFVLIWVCFTDVVSLAGSLVSLDLFAD